MTDWKPIETAPKDETTASNAYTEQEFFNRLRDIFLLEELPITQFSQSLTAGNFFDGEIVDIHGNVMKISARDRKQDVCKIQLKELYV